MKTPEEIKKGLAACSADECHGQHEGCTYQDQLFCTMRMCGDALTYIQKLESHVKELVTSNNRLDEIVAQTERERDAAKKDLENSAPCFACYHFIRNNGACKGGMRCCDEQFKAEIGHSEYDGPEWKWRGICLENTKEEK